MSAAEYRAAFADGIAACRAGQATTDNPHRQWRVHFLADEPGPRDTALARLWLAGWHTAAEERRKHPATEVSGDPV